MFYRTKNHVTQSSLAGVLRPRWLLLDFPVSKFGSFVYWQSQRDECNILVTKYDFFFFAKCLSVAILSSSHSQNCQSFCTSQILYVCKWSSFVKIFSMNFAEYPSAANACESIFVDLSRHFVVWERLDVHYVECDFARVVRSHH